MLPRYCGIENEYDVFFYEGWSLRTGDGITTLYPQWTGSPAQRRITLFRFLDNCEEEVGFSTVSFEFWLANGGRFYVDGTYAEYASPECSSIRDLVCVERAGEYIVPVFFRKHAREFVFVAKRTTGARTDLNTTGGSHESYAIAPRLFTKLTTQTTPQPYWQYIVLFHLASRIIYTGAGHVLQDEHNPYSVSFLISPRSLFIKNSLGMGSTNARPLIHLRNEPLAYSSTNPTKRFHLICGDNNRSDWTLYLKYSATKLLFLFLEIASYDVIDKLYTAMQNTAIPHFFMSAVSSGDAAAFAEALRIQYCIRDALLEQQSFLAPLFPEFDTVLERLSLVLDDLASSHGTKLCADKLDWCIKSSLFDLSRCKTLNKINRVLNFDLRYHTTTDSSHDAHSLLVKKGLISSLYAPSDFKPFITTPPSGRAQLRADTFRRIRELHLERYTLPDWSDIELIYNSPHDVAVLFKTPLHLDDASFHDIEESIERFLKRLAKIRRKKSPV